MAFWSIREADVIYPVQCQCVMDLICLCRMEWRCGSRCEKTEICRFALGLSVYQIWQTVREELYSSVFCSDRESLARQCLSRVDGMTKDSQSVTPANGPVDKQIVILANMLWFNTVGGSSYY
jgi:hypothetical protein